MRDKIITKLQSKGITGILGFFILFAMIAIPLGCGGSSKVGQRTDFNEKLHTLDGEVLDFSRFEGKVVFLNFWATWCGPCIAEKPSIDQLYQKFKDDPDVVFALVSNEKPDVVKNFVSSRDYSFPIYTVRQFPRAFEVRGIPATFILGPDGKVAHQFLGGRNWNDDQYVEMIKNLKS